MLTGSHSTGIRWRRVWKYAWRIGCIIAGLGIVVLVALSFDDRRMDTTGLRYVPRLLSETENGYLVLAKAADQLGKPDELSGDDFRETLYGRRWDSSQVEAWLADRDFAIAAIRKVRSFEFGQRPVPGDIYAAYGSQPAVSLPIQLAVLSARKHLRVGNTTDATTLLCDALHAVVLVQGSRGDVLTHVYTLAAHAMAMEAAYAVISDRRTSIEDCWRLGDQISRSRPAREDFLQMLAADLRIKELLVEALAHPQNLQGDWKMGRLDSIGYRIPFLYKPNRTLNYIIPRYLDYESVIDVPFNAMRSKRALAEKEHSDLCELHGEWLNGYGKRAAHDLLAPALGGLLRSRLNQQTNCSIGESLVALRRYHEATSGQLPASLDEMVPDYLSSVPMDYADGLPLKYSKEMKALWSAGEKHFTLSSGDQEVAKEVMIVPVRFHVSYSPWKQIVPDQSEKGAGGFWSQ